jgi:hypothetical protein
MALRFRLIFALVIGFGLVSMAVATTAIRLYLPVVYNQGTPTPTGTTTGTPTKTPTPTTTGTPTRTPTITPTGTIFTPTPSSTPTQTPSPTPTERVYVVRIIFKADYPLDEYVEIRNNTSSTVVLTNWKLKDDSGNTYTFPIFTVLSGKNVKIWTKWGVNTLSDLYWGSNVPIWNDHEDCAYLRDENDEPVHALCYSTGLFGITTWRTP